MMISFGFPYYLYDAPRVPAYINAYSTHEAMQKAALVAGHCARSAGKAISAHISGGSGRFYVGDKEKNTVIALFGNRFRLSRRWAAKTI
ncbi:hypothetical protein [Neorhizobium sp. DT-125]|uniref:hypothetical protein n=1 Tax=Neorhizobium sp. DT-125 TaxID=3396163 RepID=UPI003F1AF21B